MCTERAFNCCHVLTRTVTICTGASGLSSLQYFASVLTLLVCAHVCRNIPCYTQLNPACFHILVPGDVSLELPRAITWSRGEKLERTLASLSLILKRAAAPHVLGLIFSHSVWCSPGVNKEIAQLEKENSPLLQYPTSFTQGIVPKQIHSHNDYWRDVPVLTALSFGVASIEADVWLVNGTLMIGHERAALTKARTFDSLYIQPLLTIINNANPKDPFTTNQTVPNGVFDTASSVPLQLLVDIKTDGVETLPFVLRALEPLRSAGYLTTFANGTLTTLPVTVVGTGNSPLEPIKALEPRDFFFDAPLTELSVPTNTTWSPELSPVASTDYATAVGWSGIGNISEAQRANITKFVHDAQSRGIASRFWDTPGWPISARTAIWQELLNDGAFWLNADDLEAASSF